MIPLQWWSNNARICLPEYAISYQLEGEWNLFLC